ncbi:phage tail sheath family protein [Pantanalinema rosaneae CENA516]|uniref:phage tail sheath family protein n=1 Tax=Pantanalinema rosaneae TaxID=1620701 RepID=UPI003D6F9D0A
MVYQKYQTPGVYLEKVPQPQGTQLPTGIPGFVGFAPESIEGGIQNLDANTPRVLSRKQEFNPNGMDQLDATGNPISYLSAAISGFFDNGGTRCYVVQAAMPDPDSPTTRQTALQTSVDALAPIDDIDLIAVPDAALLPASEMISVQQYVLNHCATQGDRIAILDSISSQHSFSIQDQRKLLKRAIEPINGALYYPWIKVPNPDLSSQEKTVWVPPSGHVAGIFARSDRNRGVFKAPANEEILGVLDLEVLLNHTTQGALNEVGINGLRSFPGRGIRVWGARTLSSEPTWRYINVRRLVLTIERWIHRNMLWATFQLNSLQLWLQIQRELSTYLESLWRAGAFQGQTPAQAFYVKCDAETNPPEVREIGSVITEIGLAVSAPAEFLIIRIMQRDGGLVMV